jgi:hypothetical protein
MKTFTLELTQGQIHRLIFYYIRGCATLGGNTETEFDLLTKLQNLRSDAERTEPLYSPTIQKYVNATEPIYNHCNERVR